jgi:hypothetical protein
VEFIAELFVYIFAMPYMWLLTKLGVKEDNSEWIGILCGIATIFLLLSIIFYVWN